MQWLFRSSNALNNNISAKTAWINELRWKSTKEKQREKQFSTVSIWVNWSKCQFTIISDYNLRTKIVIWLVFSNETTVSATDGQHNGLNDPLIYTHIDRLIVYRIYNCTFLVLLPYCCSTNIFMIHLLIRIDRCFITSANSMYYLVPFLVHLVLTLI